jgi:hypothetical protein
MTIRPIWRPRHRRLRALTGGLVTGAASAGDWSTPSHSHSRSAQRVSPRGFTPHDLQDCHARPGGWRPSSTDSPHDAGQFVKSGAALCGRWHSRPAHTRIASIVTRSPIHVHQVHHIQHVQPAWRPLATSGPGSGGRYTRLKRSVLPAPSPVSRLLRSRGHARPLGRSEESLGRRVMGAGERGERDRIAGRLARGVVTIWR